MVESTPPPNLLPIRPSSPIDCGRQPSSNSLAGSALQNMASSTKTTFEKATPAPSPTSQDSSPSHDSSTSQDSSTATTATNLVRQIRKIFFMTQKGAMHPGSMGLGRSEISTHGKCNDRFFTDIRNGYWSYRGWIRMIFSIYQFGYCEFYQVSMT
jgi:hypothetical protein